MLKLLEEMFIQNSIPSAYDDSLTWYEVIGKFHAKINEAVETIIKYVSKLNEIISDRNNTIKGKINEVINSLSKYSEQCVTIFNALGLQVHGIAMKSNTNADVINANNENLRTFCNSVSMNSVSVVSTLYTSTYGALKVDSYDPDTKTLKIKWSKSDIIRAVDHPELTDVLTGYDETTREQTKWAAPAEITNNIEEVD